MGLPPSKLALQSASKLNSEQEPRGKCLLQYQNHLGCPNKLLMLLRPFILDILHYYSQVWPCWVRVQSAVVSHSGVGREDTTIPTSVSVYGTQNPIYKKPFGSEMCQVRASAAILQKGQKYLFVQTESRHVTAGAKTEPKSHRTAGPIHQRHCNI